MYIAVVGVGPEGVLDQLVAGKDYKFMMGPVVGVHRVNKRHRGQGIHFKEPRAVLTANTWSGRGISS